MPRSRFRTELDDINDDQLRRSKRAQYRKRARQDPGFVRRVQGWGKTWPTVPARTKALLAARGVDADSPVGEQVAQLSAKAQARQQGRMDKAKNINRGGQALADAAAGGTTGGEALTAVAGALASREAPGRAPAEEQDPRLLQMMAQNQATGGGLGGPASSSGQNTLTTDAAFEIQDKDDARGVLEENGPLTFQQVDRLWEIYPEMSGTERERLRDRLAGINPQRRAARAQSNGVAFEDEPHNQAEQKRLSTLRTYESQLRNGQMPQGRNPNEERILSEMRVRLAGVDVNEVRKRGALTPDETLQIDRYMRKEKEAEIGIDAPLRAVAAGTRALGTALQAPYEFAQGMVREQVTRFQELGEGEIVNRTHPGAGDEPFLSSARATTAGQVASALAGGRPVDQGTGIFPSPDSPIGKAQAEAAREQAEFYGQAVTPGRLVARGLVATGLIDPDSSAYNVASGLVDFAAAVSPFDPTNVLLDSYTAAKQSSRVFRTGVAGTEGKAAFARATFDSWLTGSEGQKATSELWKRASSGDFAGVRQIIPNNVEVAVRVMNTQSVDEMNGVLRAATGLKPLDDAPAFVPASGRLLVEKPRIPSSVSGGILKPLDNIRLVHDVPNRPIDPEDPDQALETFDLVQRNAKFPSELREKNNAAFAQALITGGRPAIMPIYTKMLDDLVEQEVGRFARSIRGKRGGEEAVKAFHDEMSSTHGRVFMDSYEDARRYMIDEYGNNTVPGSVAVGGNNEVLAEPSRFVEFLSRPLPVPDPREVRQNVSWLHSLYQDELTGPFIRGSATALDTFYTKAFKPLALITRIAYPVRVIGEEQFRIGASGLDSMFSGHPVSWMSWVIGRKGGITEDDMARAAQEVVSGKPNAFGDAMSRGSGPLRLLDDERGASQTIRVKQRMRYKRGEDRYAVSWAEELLKDHNDPIVSAIAKTPVSEVKDRLWDGDLAWARHQIARNGGRWGDLDQRAFSDEIVDFYAAHIKTVTRDDPELLDAIKTGSIDGERIVVGKARPKMNGSAVKKLKERAEREEAPDWMPGDVVTHKSARDISRYDNVIQTMFSGMMGYPTDKLSRSVVFRQAYWQRVIDILPSAKDMDTAAAILKRAENMDALGPRTRAFATKMGISEEWATGIPKAMREQMRRQLSKVGSGALSKRDIELAAQAHGLDVTRDLLYDLSKRNNAFDITRHIFPFGDAFKEVTTRWAKLFRENPKAWYRFQQGYEATHENGWVHKNAYGEDVVTYPGFGLLTEEILGVPVPLDGPVANMNMIGQAYPGFGPAMQLPVMWFLPDKAEWDWLHELVFPYGEPANKDPFSFIENTILPAWSEKVAAALGRPEGEQMIRRTTTKLAMELKSSGEYGTGPDEFRRLMRDAKTGAKKLLFVQGIAQGILPSSPLLDFKVLDRDGNLFTLAKVAEEFHLLREDQGHEHALTWLVGNYGKDIFPIVQGISSDLVFGLVNTQEAYDWERDHSGFMDEFKNVGGFFAPRGDDDKYDPSVYQRRIDRGDKVIPEPEVTMRVANDIWARHLYEEAKTEHGDDDAYMRRLKKRLKNDYPGFESDVGKVGKADEDERIEEIERAAKDPTVRDTDTARAIREYAAERAWAAKEAAGRDVTNWWEAKSTQDIAEYMSEFQSYLRKKYGRAINDVLDQVYSRDVRGLEED